MKYIVLAVLLFGLTFSAHAQGIGDGLPLKCAPSNGVLDKLNQQKFLPIWMGKTEADDNVMIFKENGKNWFEFVFVQDKTNGPLMCLVASGSESTITKE